jgi:hypothetical protein
MTKTLSLVLVLLAAAPRAATAQSFEIGVKGGVTFATQTGGAEEIESLGVTERIFYGASLAIGGAFAFALTERVAFQPEVLFVQKAHETQLRGSFPDDPSPLEFDGRVTQNYLELPMLLRVAVGARGVQLLAGPSVNVSLDCWECGDAVDVGIAVGAGFYGSTLTMEGRYEEGLSDTTDLFRGNGGSRRNRAFLFLVGVRRR